MVIDELIVRKGTTNLPIDSYDDKKIDEIVYEGQKFHFAKQKDLEGVTEVVADNAVQEPMRELGIEGNTTQKTTTGKNLIDPEKLAELILKYHQGASLVTVDGRRCIKFVNNRMHGKDLTACCPEFKVNTRYIFSFEARPNTIIPEDDQNSGSLFVGFKPINVTAGMSLSAKTTTDFTRMYAVNNVNTTVTDINISYGSAHTWLIDLDSIYLYEYDGNDNPPYEEYTGRIPSPNVEYPQLIENSTNVSVELGGVNRLISPSNFENIIDLNNYVKYDISTQVYNINLTKFGMSKGIYHFDTPIPSGTPYTLLAEVINNDFEINYNFALGLYKKDDTGAAWAGSTLDLNTLSQSNRIVYKTGVTNQPTTDIWLFKNYDVNSYARNLKVRFLVYFGEQTITEWQPYFAPTKVDIPSEVTLADGTVVPLRFAKVDDSADTLVVDKIIGKCTYIGKVGLKVFDGTESFVNAGSGYPYRYIPNGIKRGNNIPLICNYFRNVHNTQIDSTSSEGTFCQHASMWYFNYDSQRGGIDNFKSKLAEWYTNGNPMIIQYQYATPKEYDLTNTDLGQQLLEFSKTEYGTNILTITSDLPVSKTDLAYWRQILPNE